MGRLSSISSSKKIKLKHSSKIYRPTRPAAAGPGGLNNGSIYDEHRRNGCNIAGNLPLISLLFLPVPYPLLSSLRSSPLIQLLGLGSTL